MQTRYLMRIIFLFHGLRNYGGNLREGHSLKVDESSMTGENKDKYLFGGIDQQSTQGKVCVVDSYYCPQSIR
ncbi:hypothetical protein ACJW30_04G155900 [Castanea mollissima]